MPSVEIIVALALLTFFIGYILGRLSVIERLLGIARGPGDFLGKPKKSKGWISAEDKPTRIVNIGESKFVTEVSTDSFTSRHKSLGKKTVSLDGIGASVSKLKNLKERK